MSVQKINQPHVIGIGDYYQYVGDPPEEGERDAWEPGDLVLILKIADDGITYQHFNSTIRCPVDDFYDEFEFDPDGEAKRERQMQAVVKSLSEPLEDFDSFSRSLNSAQLLLTTSNPAGEVVEGNPVTALVQNRDFLTTAKADLMSKKINADLIKDRMEERKTALDRLLAEKKALLDARMTQMKEMIARVEYVIHMVNLYLGEDVEVFTLRSGRPAAASEIIAARQLVLYCDQECMVAADDGGIDFQNYEQFDRWLLKRKKNVDQVLPEQRGIVALQLRREGKHYSDDPFQNILMNKENFQTYLLIRNGENLYRIIVPINFGPLFFPKKGEFEGVFMAEERWGVNRGEKRRIRPGTFEYETAMEKADARQRYYLRNVLLIQGIMDRTQVFAPLAVERPNILNPEEAVKVMRFIHDGESLLSDGRLSFDQWLLEVNSQTTRGCRVMGTFNGYGTLHVDYDRRIHPKGARRPDWQDLHVIDRIEKNGDREDFVFLYDRKGEMVYGNWYTESHEAKTRASMRLRPGDDFWLNFDAIEPADIRFYLDDRLSRHRYINMAPLLRRAMVLKIQEREYEKPFRLLVQGELLKEGLTATEQEISDLMAWWKFKAADHRAINADDAKAIRMITQEAKARQRRASLASKADALSDQTLPIFRNEGALFVYRSAPREFQVGYPANDKNVFFHRVTWAVSPDGNLIEKDRKEWFTVNLRAASWNGHCLYGSSRWEKWVSVPRRAEVLSDPELNTLRGAMTAAFEMTRMSSRRHGNYDANCVPMAIGLAGPSVTMYFIRRDDGKKSETHHVYRDNYPYYSYVSAPWKRTRQGLEIEQPLGWSSRETAGFNRRTERDWFDYKHPGFLDDTELLLWFDPSVFADFEKRHKQAIADQELKETHGAMMEVLTDPIKDIITDAIWAKRKVEFFAEGGQEAQWEAFRKKKYKLDQIRNYPHRTRRAVLALLENSLSIAGKTVAQVWQEAEGFSVVFEEHDSDADYYQNIATYIFTEVKEDEK